MKFESSDCIKDYVRVCEINNNNIHTDSDSKVLRVNVRRRKRIMVDSSASSDKKYPNAYYNVLLTLFFVQL